MAYRTIGEPCFQAGKSYILGTWPSNRMLKTHINEQALQKILKSACPDNRIRFYNKKIKLPFRLLKIGIPIKIDDLHCGLADYLIAYKSKHYIMEAKASTKPGTDIFWRASKVLAYTKILNYIHQEKYRPAILIPEEYISLKIVCLCRLLEITLFKWYSFNEEIYIEEIKQKKLP